MAIDTADTRSDVELVLAAAGNDESAWDALIVRYAQFVYSNARGVGADHALAEDIVQMVWMKLLHHIDRINKPASIRGWLAIASRNTTRTELIKSNRTTALPEAATLVDPTPGPEALADHQSDVADLKRCLNLLNETCRELVWMRFGAEMPLREISETQQMPMGSIGPRQGRCLEKLADCLAQSA